MKCFSVAQRVMSVPISNRGSLSRGFLVTGGSGKGVTGAGPLCSQRLDVGIDGAIAGGELGLTGIEEFEILL